MTTRSGFGVSRADKCAISLVMGRDKDIAGGSDAGAGLTDDLFGGVGGLRDTDVASVLSDNDASLIQAMSLMSDEGACQRAPRLLTPPPA